MNGFRASRTSWSIAAVSVLSLLAVPAAVNAQVAVEAAALQANAAKGTAAAKVVKPSKSAVTSNAVVPAAAIPAAVVAAAPQKAATALAPMAADNAPACLGDLPEPTRVRLSAGKATLVNLPEQITRRTLGDPIIVEGRMVSPTVLYLVAGRIGATNAILQGVSGRCTVLDIVVAIDIDAIKSKLAEVLPGELNVKITAAADSLIVSGSVADALAAEHVISIANAYVRAAYQQGVTGSTPPSTTTQQFTVNGVTPLSVRVVNLLSVSAAQQVMLEVKVAEVAKTVLDKLGASLGISRSNGSWTYQLLSNFLNGLSGGLVGAAQVGTRNGLALEAEKRDGLIRILAEPNVMAISGQEGSFLAGGKVLIPVAQRDSLTGQTITLEEKEFGVGLKFTPTVLADGRINLRVAPEVSELSREGIGISNFTGAGTAVFPLITTRRASTTVQLYDGQSFAIGGLIKSTQAANIKAFPVLGEIPILGALFRSNDFQEEKTELVFVVTPRLVKPLPAEFRLPTDRVGETSRHGMLIDGQLGSPGSPAKPKPDSGMQIK
jgi:pilus assembly protein CpaC